MAEDKTDAEIDHAYREWCAMVDVSPIPTGTRGSFQLVRAAPDLVRIEQVVADGGEVRPIVPAMTRGQFCDAVRFVHESFNIKTVQVARMVAGRRKRRSWPG